MFKKENIIIVNENFFSGKIFVDYAKNLEDLYALVVKIVKELKINSLSKIIIDNAVVFTGEAGKVKFSNKKKQLVSEIEINRFTFVQFNNEKDIKLKNEALSTIYHELYHIYDRENILNRLRIGFFKLLNYKFFEIGLAYWSEFFAYYKSLKFHISEYPYVRFESINDKIRLEKPDKNIVFDLFYCVSAIIAYESDNSSRYCNNKTCVFAIQNNSNYKKLKDKLYSIIDDYPQNITYDLLVELGVLYCNLIKYYSYKISFKRNKMVIERSFENLTKIE